MFWLGRKTPLTQLTFNDRRKLLGHESSRQHKNTSLLLVIHSILTVLHSILTRYLSKDWNTLTTLVLAQREKKLYFAPNYQALL